MLIECTLGGGVHEVETEFIDDHDLHFFPLDPALPAGRGEDLKSSWAWKRSGAKTLFFCPTALARDDRSHGAPTGVRWLRK